MAWYEHAIKKEIPPPSTGQDPPIKARLAILHVRAGEGPSLYPYFNGPSGGIESHFYIRYDGTIEQYRDTDFQADANTDANPWAVSIETEGLEFGTWTDEQLASIKALLLWLHEVEQIPMSVPTTWDGSGMGFHTLFPDRWDKRGASCPGPNRKKQFYDVLVPWMASGGEDDDMTPDQAKKFEEIWSRVYNAEKAAEEAVKWSKNASARIQLFAAESDPTQLAAKLAPLLAGSDGPVTDEQLDASLRRVLGSLDDTPAS